MAQDEVPIKHICSLFVFRVIVIEVCRAILAQKDLMYDVALYLKQSQRAKSCINLKSRGRLISRVYLVVVCDGAHRLL